MNRMNLLSFFVVSVCILGMACVVQCLNEDLWYRAEIVDIAKFGMVKVKLVDYGIMSMTSVFKLRQIIDRFRTCIPVQVGNIVQAASACR